MPGSKLRCSAIAMKAVRLARSEPIHISMITFQVSYGDGIGKQVCARRCAAVLTDVLPHCKISRASLTDP